MNLLSIVLVLGLANGQFPTTDRVDLIDVNTYQLFCHTQPQHQVVFWEWHDAESSYGLVDFRWLHHVGYPRYDHWRKRWTLLFWRGLKPTRVITAGVRHSRCSPNYDIVTEAWKPWPWGIRRIR